MFFAALDIFFSTAYQDTIEEGNLLHIHTIQMDHYALSITNDPTFTFLTGRYLAKWTDGQAERWTDTYYFNSPSPCGMGQ